MSSENGSDCSNGGGLVCRDFLRNVCRRGKRCKYSHPHSKEEECTTTRQDSKFEYHFCHDFQNSACKRSSCRFVHGTPEDEEYYKFTGELPPHILNSVMRKGLVPDVGLPNGPQCDVPVCKDYLKGECRRGGKCKFRHLAIRDYEMELSYNRNSSPSVKAESHHILPEYHDDRYNNTRPSYNMEFEREYGPPDAKRRHFEAPSQPIFIREGTPINHHCYPPSFAHMEARSMFYLQDENAILRKRIEDYKKQVSDLTATNEFLLDQNAQLRMSGKRTGVAVAVPAVTITNAGTSTMQVQPITAQIQSNTIPTSQHMVNAAVAGTLRTVTASVATVPVSIATVAGTPVSIATVSMAPVQMQPPIVTMAQAIHMDGVQNGHNQHHQSVNQANQVSQLPMSLSGTAPVVSYPIMTHELRPVTLQTSLSH